QTRDAHPTVEAARLFADIASIGDNLKNGVPLDEGPATIASQVSELVQRFRFDLSQICYLPSDEERALLGHTMWKQDDASAGLSLSQIKQYQNRAWAGKDLAILEGNYIRKEASRYFRNEFEKMPLYSAILVVLKSAEAALKPEEIGTRLRSRL